jgi:hypothetical protein
MGERERIRAGRSEDRHQHGSTAVEVRPRRSFLRVVFPAYLLIVIFAFRQLRESVGGTFLGYQYKDGSSTPYSSGTVKNSRPQIESQTQQQQTQLDEQSRAFEFWLGFQDDDDGTEEMHDENDGHNDGAIDDKGEIYSRRAATGKNDTERKYEELDDRIATRHMNMANIPAAMEKRKNFAERLRMRDETYGGRNKRRMRQPRITRDSSFIRGWAPPLVNADFSKYPILESTTLPDMTTDKGGVIFFLHVPKVSIYCISATVC